MHIEAPHCDLTSRCSSQRISFSSLVLSAKRSLGVCFTGQAQESTNGSGTFVDGDERTSTQLLNYLIAIIDPQSYQTIYHTSLPDSFYPMMVRSSITSWMLA